MSNVLDNLRNWLKPVSEGGERTPYVRVWALLREIKLKDLWPVFLSVPAIVFFALSGLVAWLVLICKWVYRFIVGIFRG